LRDDDNRSLDSSHYRAEQEAVYKIVEVVGVSEKSWEEAARTLSLRRRDPCATCGSRK